MRQNSKFWRPVNGPALWIALAASIGCGGEQQSLVPVTGVVTLDSRPLPTGSVITTTETGQGARGVIDVDGQFKLETPGAGEGAVAGEHFVSVIAYESTNPGAMEAESKSLVPDKYMSAYNSGLVIDVKPQKKNHFELKLSR